MKKEALSASFFIICESVFLNPYKHLSKDISVHTALGDADPYLIEAGVEDIGPVAGAVHQVFMSAFSSRGSGNVFTGGVIFNAGISHHVKW